MPNSQTFLSPESLSAVGLLVVAVGVLWRAFLAEMQANRKMVAEMTASAQTMNSLARALDRLRVEGCAHSSRGSSGDLPR